MQNVFPLGAIGQRVRLLIARLRVQFPQWNFFLFARKTLIV